jgi:hypothetical protein
VILGIRALLSAMAEDVAEAGSHRPGRAMLLDLGPSVAAITTSTGSGLDRAAGRSGGGRGGPARDSADLEAIKERYFRSSIAGYAHSLIALGELDRAFASAEPAGSSPIPTTARPDPVAAGRGWVARFEAS